MEENRMTFGAYLKAYIKQCLEVLKHPKMLLPTAILAVVWIGLGILQNKVERNLPLSILNFLTFAQGGLYGGILGGIGGVLGKIVVAAFVNVMIVPLFYKKNPFANLKQGFNDVLKTAKFESTEAFVSLLKGFGAALLLYSIFNLTQSLENSMVGIVSAVALVSAAARKGGSLWGLVLSWMNTVSKGKVPTQQRLMRALTGMTLGFTLGVVLSAAGSMWAGSLGIIALVVGWIMGRKSRKETVATMVLILLVLLPKIELWAKSSGVWTLVDVKTEVNPTATSKSIHDDPITVKLSGTTASYRVDYTYGNEAGYFTGSITPFYGSYAPGETLTCESTAQLVQGTRWMEVVIGNWNRFWFDFGGYTRDDAAKIGWEFRDDLGTFDFTFPFREDVGADHFTIYEEVAEFDAYIRTAYQFKWNAKGKSNLSSSGDDWDDIEIKEISLPEWINKLFGTDGEHASNPWSILIGFLGAIGGLGGGLGGAIGGGIGGGGIPTGNIPGGESPSGNGPVPENEPTPEELEWQRYQNELEDRRNRYVRDNPDGTRTVIDPATGNTQTLYPRYNTETGAPDGWVNENDTHYNDESLNDWLAWRERNSDTFAQDAAQAERNLEEQRAMNKAQNDYDRQRGSSATADKWKAEKEKLQKQQARQEHLDDLANKYGLVNPTPQELKRALKKEMLDAHQEGAEAMIDAAKWNDWVNGAEIVEQTADTLINVLGETSPQARLLKNQYTALKAIAKRGMESATRRESVWKGLAHGAAEGVLSVAQNQGYTSVMGEMGKSVLNDLMDPEKKSWKEILDNATKNGVRRFGYDLVGKFVGNLGDKAFGDTVKNIATSNPDAAKQIVQAFEGSKQVTSFAQEMGFHNNAADEIAEYLNLKRQQILGI